MLVLIGIQERPLRAVAQARHKCNALLVRHLRRRRALRIERRRRRVIERAQQARDIAQRACLLAPLGERSAGLALEVDDVDVAACDQHLPEMEVAMDAGFRGADARLGELAQRARQRFVLRQQPLGLGF